MSRRPPGSNRTDPPFPYTTLVRSRWAVNSERVVEAALGYYINPLITVALGIVVLGEHLRRLQVVALAFAVAAVAVLTVAYGRVPWVSLTLACSFATYGFIQKSVPVKATTSLAVEPAVLAPLAVTGIDRKRVVEGKSGSGR